MAQLRKIMVSLPDSLIKEIDSIVSLENINRSEFVREATKLYLREKNKLYKKEVMKKGYLEMAEINAALAQLCAVADEEQLGKYEERLGEMDI